MNKLAILCLVLLSSSLALATSLRSRVRANEADTVLLETMGGPDPCDGVCCGDNGHCEDGSCVCKESYVGELCDDRHPCFEIDCGDNGSCYVDNEDEFGGGVGHCYCAPGWIGERCEIPNVECEGDFTEWTECSTTCEEGFQYRTYVVDVAQSGWGCECPIENGHVETKDCYLRNCPIYCIGHWGEFGDCSQTCEEGTKTRNMIITTEAQWGGIECETTDTATCNLGGCPVDCEGHWSDYDECSTTCNPGFQTKTFIVDIAAEFNGQECEHDNGALETRDCNDGYDDVCAIHCEGNWSGYDTCSVTCGGGIHHKTYSVTTEANHKGNTCPHADGETSQKACNTDGCPVDCVGAWGEFTECSASCGGGDQTQTFHVSVQAENGGKNCNEIYEATDLQTNTQACNTHNCPEHCEGDWSVFTECPVTCSTGNIYQTFTITKEAQYGGLECDYEDGAVNTETCDEGPCPIDCEGSFGDWSECANEDMCGTGEQSRTFNVTVEERYGGEACAHPDDHVATKSCDLVPCPIDCEGEFDEWTSCSVSCSDGTKTRTFKVSVEPLYGGEPCPEPETAACNERECPVDCVGDWNEWGACTESCGTDGTQDRSFVVTTAAAHGGAECAHADGVSETQACNLWECPDLCHGVCCGDYGHCSEGVCVCYHGWTGPACEIQVEEGA